jgi:hypothetical protein
MAYRLDLFMSTTVLIGSDGTRSVLTVYFKSGSMLVELRVDQ